MTIKELIENLQKKADSLPDDTEVECLVCTTDGMLIAAIVETQARAMRSALKLFDA